MDLLSQRRPLDRAMHNSESSAGSGSVRSNPSLVQHVIQVEDQTYQKKSGGPKGWGGLLSSSGRAKEEERSHGQAAAAQPYEEGEEKLFQVRLKKGSRCFILRGSIARMERSPVRWPSEADDSTLIHPSEMSSLDHFDAQEIVGLLGEDFEYPLSLENRSSSSSFDPAGNTDFNSSFNCSFMEASERPIGVIEAEGIPGAVPNACSISFISTGDPETVRDPLQPWPRNGSESFYSHGPAPNEKTLDFQRPERNSMAISRPTSQDHVIAERKRREKLSQQFIALSAVIPGLKKTDKATLLGEAINYLKQLEAKEKTLEEQAVRKSAEPTVLVKKSRLSTSNHASNANGSSPGEAVEEIEASLEGKTVLLRIHCAKKKGVLVKVLSEIEKLQLSVISAGVVPFADSSLNITVTAQIEEGFSITMKDLVKELNSALS